MSDKIKQLPFNALKLIEQVLNVSVADIKNITTMKKGMTNYSFSFVCKGLKYVIRVPGEGANCLINRRQETNVYKEIAKRGICDDPIYIDPDTGYKIALFLDDFRVCNPVDESDLTLRMEKLRAFHDMKLSVGHEFDIFKTIEFYENLREGTPSIYEDYKQTKRNISLLKPYINAHIEEKCLAHIDAVPDNFLFFRQQGGDVQLQLIDWEYAGMQDPHIDIAMFCIYSLYDRPQVDRLIDLYFQGTCSEETRIKVYCYIAAGGLLWSNWCEYKRKLGVQFGEYAFRQYQFAKDYYELVQKKLNL